MFWSDQKRRRERFVSQQAAKEAARACALMADAEMRSRAKIHASYRPNEERNRAHQWSMGVQAEALRDAIGRRFNIEVPTETMESACLRADANFEQDV